MILLFAYMHNQLETIYSMYSEISFDTTLDTKPRAPNLIKCFFLEYIRINAVYSAEFSKSRTIIYTVIMSISCEKQVKHDFKSNNYQKGMPFDILVYYIQYHIQPID